VRRFLRCLVSSLRGNQHNEGQAIVFAAIFLVVMIGMAGLVIDGGQEHVLQTKLQAAANAAALAAGEYLPNVTASSAACTYGASQATAGTCNGVTQVMDGYNFDTSRANGVTTQIKLECLSVASAGISCATGTACPGVLAPAGNPHNQGCNAIQVSEQTNVTPSLMRLLPFGFGNAQITAVATASAAGGVPHPLDVEMVDDTTESMTTTDSCGGTPTDVPPSVSLTQEDCAKAGIRALLSTLLPCAGSVCGPDVAGTDNVASPLDEVGMVTFPGLNSSVSQGSGLGVPDELDCTKELSTSDVTYGSSASYQAVPFSSDFRVSDAATTDPLATLNPASNLVQSVYWPGDSCPNGGYPTPGGQASSIAGGGSGDASTATSNASGIGGGAGVANDSTSTVNSGIAVAGSTSTATSPLVIGGGPNSGSSLDTATSSTNSGTGISVNRPATHVANDFLLLTVTGQGAGVVSASTICPSSTTTGWTLVDQKRESGAAGSLVIQETYSSLRSTAAAETYAFNFFTGACVSGVGNGTLTLSASALVVRYTNVASIDSATGATGIPGAASFAGSAPSTAWRTTGTKASGSITSAAYSSTARFDSFSSTTSCTSACDTLLPSAANILTGATFTFTTGTASDEVFTVSLLVDDAVPTTGSPTCKIGTTTTSGATTCTIAGSWAVSGGTSTMSLKVVESSGTTPLSSKGSATASYTGDIDYVSLSSACASVSASVCDVATVASPGGTLTAASLTLGANVPTGDTSTVALLQNGAASGSSCTIAATKNTCSIAASLALSTGDNLELEVTTAGTAVFTATATATTAAETIQTTLIAPALPLGTTQPDEQVVRLFGSGSSSFTSLTAPPLVAASSSTATGADDAPQPAAGATGTESVTSTTPDDWVAQTVALIATQPSSIAVTPASGYAGAVGDFLVVSIAAQNLGSGSICAPDTTWTPVPVPSGGDTVTSGTLTQESFWTTLSTVTAPAMDTFSFETSCTGTGTFVPAAASAVAIDYTGVDPGTAPITATSAPNLSGATATAPASTAPAGDEVVSLFATNARFSAANPPSIDNTSSAWTNSGADDSVQTTAGNAAVSVGTSAAANWTAETVALTPLLSSSITFTPPSLYVPGDFLLVSIAVQNLGSASICAPTDATWTPVPLSATQPVNTTTSGTLTQEAFWTTTSEASSDTFTFDPTSSCGGTSVDLQASAVAVNYTGVSPTTPLDGVTPLAAHGVSSPLNPGPVVTRSANDDVISLFATTAASLIGPTAVSGGGGGTNSGASNVTQAIAGSVTPASATSAPAAGAWTTETLALQALGSNGVTIARPPNPTSDDFLLVTVTTKGLTAAGNSICAPDDGTWTQVGSLTSKGTISQATFWSARPTAQPENYTFTFQSAGCPSGGSPLSAPASAIAVRFTGVDPVPPIDLSPAAVGGSSTTVAPPSVTPTYLGDELVGLYGTAATSFSAGIPSGQSVSGSASATGFSDTNDPPSGIAVAPASATIASNSWIGQTIALEAASGGCANSCEYGLEDPGGAGTDYGPAINAAQSALVAQEASRSTAKNVIILLSDGDANQTDGGVTEYPCQYGITAAENAERAGTQVIAVAYGALYDQSTDRSCTDDTQGTLAGLTAQCAMELIADNSVTNAYSASNLSGFESDSQAEAALCPAGTYEPSNPPENYYNQEPGNDLAGIFRSIGEALSSPRLLSNNAQ